MISRITHAEVRNYPDTSQAIAWVTWTDSKGQTGQTSGDAFNPHMLALIARAQREGVAIR